MSACNGGEAAASVVRQMRGLVRCEPARSADDVGCGKKIGRVGLSFVAAADDDVMQRKKCCGQIC